MKRSLRFPVQKRTKRVNMFGEPVSESQDEAPDYIYPQELRKAICTLLGQKEKEKEKVALAALYELYREQHKLDKQRKDEIEEAKAKFRERTKEIVDQNRQIVNGKRDNETLSESERKGPVIPDFWSKTIKNSSFQTIISKKDTDAIDTLTNLIVDYAPSTKSINIQLHFDPNPVFSNKVLRASLTQKSVKLIKHTFDKPKFGKGYKKLQKCFFSLFTKLEEHEAIKYYEYWLNFVLKELPQAMVFYFQLREGTHIARIPCQKEESQEEEEEYLEQEVVEERPKRKWNDKAQGGLFGSQSKGRSKGKKQKSKSQEEEEQSAQEPPKSKSKSKVKKIPPPPAKKTKTNPRSNSRSQPKKEQPEQKQSKSRSRSKKEPPAENPKRQTIRSNSKKAEKTPKSKQPRSPKQQPKRSVSKKKTG